MNPDCRDGKHAACAGTGWDLERDEERDCPYPRHAAQVTS